MKFLSVLFTLALLVSVNALAAHLKRVPALPTRSTAAHANFHHIEHI